MRIGVFGGSFNPPHLGHLFMAEYIRDDQDLDRIVWIPAYRPPHKLDEAMLSSRHRLAMLRLAVAGNAAFEISDVELVRGGVSYTLHTLEQLRSDDEDDELSLIIGSDTYADFHTWHRPEEVLKIADLLVYPRHGVPARTRQRFPANMLDAPEIPISSTEIRRRVRTGRTIRYFVTDSVREYIDENGIYLGDTK